jgi:hypothetical protein
VYVLILFNLELKFKIEKFICAEHRQKDKCRVQYENRIMSCVGNKNIFKNLIETE